ncbi:hypothetical protein WA1_21945 [Scytonema hofmannii PCC 7110]|uniref:Uncharacterized protein n=1 Tax=Scytonema hofmannii PCC 7110 TaxID=128403 RepID=A0A139X9K5_9CYAN|nr:hypothetical protein [Scytonema hofmannii]KYC41369.1 hypothetical protein WA1_21945 [Scytonema hofmannii PCC 7110]
MAKDSNNFDYLVVGLAEFFRQNHNYPYPDLLQHACNKLALKMTATPYPRTLEGLFSLLGKPLLTWYPLEIPKEFDPDFGLIYDRALSEEASQYLYEQLLERFYATRDYQEHLQRGQPHWGDRWLGTACPLQGRLHSSDIIDRLEGKPLKPGTEPCHSLKKAPDGEHNIVGGKQQKTERPHLCPFFSDDSTHSPGYRVNVGFLRN